MPKKWRIFFKLLGCERTLIQKSPTGALIKEFFFFQKEKEFYFPKYSWKVPENSTEVSQKAKIPLEKYSWKIL